MLVQFGSDDVIIPHESENFQDYKGDKPIAFNSSEVISEDWIGITDLQDAGKLEHVLIPNSTHLQYPPSEPVDTFIPFLFGHRDEPKDAEEPLKFIQ
mmetsp:Transcript_4589/g.6973  ORF Transcript_4589/g.6973 Transcript_4589/m.6973 type:complete len:97 (+) Transcript_4589:692-982(+)